MGAKTIRGRVVRRAPGGPATRPVASSSRMVVSPATIVPPRTTRSYICRLRLGRRDPNAVPAHRVGEVPRRRGALRAYRGGRAPDRRWRFRGEPGNRFVDRSSSGDRSRRRTAVIFEDRRVDLRRDRRSDLRPGAWARRAASASRPVPRCTPRCQPSGVPRADVRRDLPGRDRAPCVNHRLRPDDIAFILRDAAPRFLVHSAETTGLEDAFRGIGTLIRRNQ